MGKLPDLPATLGIINTASVVGVLTIAIWLGLRGDVVTSSQLADCRAARDEYLREWIKAITPRDAESIGPIPPWRVVIGDTIITSDGPR